MVIGYEIVDGSQTVNGPNSSTINWTVMPKAQIAIIFVLSLGVWILFRWKTPEAPLGPTETLVVVVVVGAVVYAVDRAIKRFGRKKPV